MGKIKDLILDWIESYEAGIPMEWSKDRVNWFDAKEMPRFGDGNWYRKKVEEHQANDYYIPPDGVA